LKALLLLLSIFFLLGGGICSLALIAQGATAVLGIPMLALCLFTVVVVIQWTRSTSDPENKLRKKSIFWVSITALVIIVAYVMTMMALSNLGTR
jgi:isoprenylcysteine carboxyl methyltransferase (ICMT) family protein YpbQ